MATFLMLGKYTGEALGQMSAQRTKKAQKLIEQNGGQVVGMYATLGRYDLAFVLSFPGLEDAMKASVAISKLTGIGFTTLPAIAVEDFDKLVAGK
jgi:uncharacterized protein with GYD domain